ncbi:MAG: hypothetical protein K2Y26_16655 [Gemmatimonadaceae bacterium]|nr:hypothetical protein [Gemmatimonadaceae bacterium]
MSCRRDVRAQACAGRGQGRTRAPFSRPVTARPVTARPVTARTLTARTLTARTLTARWTMLAVLASVAVTGCGTRWPRAGSEAATRRWPATLIGEWSAPQRLAPGRTAPDSVVWALGAQGVMHRVEVRVRNPASPRSLSSGRLWWWIEDAPGGTSTADPGRAGRTTVLCVSQQPGRNRECGYVTLDSTGGTDRTHLRLTWTGKTFPTQRWSFVGRQGR